MNKTSNEVWKYNSILALTGISVLVTLFILGGYVNQYFYIAMLLFGVLYILFVKPKPFPTKHNSGDVK